MIVAQSVSTKHCWNTKRQALLSQTPEVQNQVRGELGCWVAYHKETPVFLGRGNYFSANFDRSSDGRSTHRSKSNAMQVCHIIYSALEENV